MQRRFTSAESVGDDYGLCRGFPMGSEALLRPCEELAEAVEGDFGERRGHVVGGGEVAGGVGVGHAEGEEAGAGGGAEAGRTS